MRILLKIIIELPPMQTSSSVVSSCRYCQYYRLEGRRGGQCQQLGVSVQGGWKACQLAIPPFAPSWENLDEIVAWQQEAAGLQQALSTTYGVLTDPEQGAEKSTIKVERTIAGFVAVCESL
jgi:hypothetical protein